MGADRSPLQPDDTILCPPAGALISTLSALYAGARRKDHSFAYTAQAHAGGLLHVENQPRPTGCQHMPD